MTAASASATRLRNKYQGWCADCRQPVPPGAGYLLGKEEGQRWRVRCVACEMRGQSDRWRQSSGRQHHRQSSSYLDDPIIRARLEQLRRLASRPPCLATLGLTPPVGIDDVKGAYRRLAMRTHPDRGGNPAEFARIAEAYQQAMALVAGGRS